MVLDTKELFDTTIGYDEEVNVQLSPNLSDKDMELAFELYRYFNELMGVCIVLGDPGSGKENFTNIVSYKIKQAFPHKRTMRDEKPRELYGLYEGLFNDKVLVDDLARMKAVAAGDNGTPRSKAIIGKKLDELAEDWVSTKGEVMLKNTQLCLSEYWRYCYNREPHAPMNKTMGAIHKMKRHLDLIIWGTVQLESDLDKKTTKPFIDWRVTCTRSIANATGFIYYIERVKYDRMRDVLIIVPGTKPKIIAFDSGRPRSNIGDGKIIITKPDYLPKNKMERRIIEALNSGIEYYEDLEKELKRIDNREILKTVKLLSFHKSKRAIWYPCYFRLFNSKSAPQIKSSIKVLED